jgi:hypothetical protein
MTARPMVHRFETDRRTGATTYTDLRTAEQRNLSQLPAERGDGKRRTLAAELRAWSAASPANAVTARAAATASPGSPTAARLARIGIR